jgi:hypothetical protein
MRRIDDDVGFGRIMDSHNLAVVDTDRFVQHLHHGCETFGCARRRFQRPVLPWFIKTIIDTDDNIEGNRFLHRGSDDQQFHGARGVAS